jgi:TM2 domain-containing membrane protein YozV
MYSVVGNDGQVYGPADMKTLEQWVKEGRIVPTTNLIDPIDGRVYRAQDLMLVAPLFEAQARTTTASHIRQNPTFTQMPVQMSYASYPRQGITGQKSKLAAILLALFLGGLGIHRFYLGHTGSGIAMLLITVLSIFTCGLGAIVTGIWAIVDIILIATDALVDSTGQKLA